MHKPLQSLTFVLLVFLALGLLSFSFPKDGITISSNLKLEFPSINSLFGEKSFKKDISKIINSLNNIDTTFAINDTIEKGTKEKIQPLNS